MRKICTVLLLNLLRSLSRPKLVLRSCAIAVVITAIGLFATSHFNKPVDVIRGQHANAIASDSPSPSASGESQAENQPAKTANPQDKKESNRTGGKSSSSTQQHSGSSTSSQASSSAELIIKSVTLDAATAVCDGQQPAYAVQAAHFATTTSIHGSGTIKWYWETRVDSAESTDTPPISPQTNTNAIAAGSMPVNIEGSSGSEPLIRAPTSSNYSYSFRLHALSPNEAVSDWISVPVVLDNSCASSN
jgi:hypothetical protein